MMKKEEILDILLELLANEANTMPKADRTEGVLEVSRLDPITDEISCYRYQVISEKKIIVKKLEDGCYTSSAYDKTFREIVWRSCRLERVCSIYKSQYENWKRENNDIPYIQTRINDDADGKPERSFEFIQNFWKEELSEKEDENRNLRLLLAEYGLGKSSYCQGIRSFAADKIKPLFLEEGVPFPFVFDLNRFRSGDFDKYVESELFDSYKVSMLHRVFEKLCQNGIFMVVLDAWDQMRSARQVPQVKQDLNQMSSLWMKKGRALITCRRSFYQQQLKIKGNLSQNVGLYKLNGFDKQSVEDYLDYKNREQRSNEVPLIANVHDWIESCWKLNKDLFEKPLNLRLLVRHFNAITSQVDFKGMQVETYKFLEIVFQEWKVKNHINEAGFLKELVLQTLHSGLNRSISLTQFQKACKDEDKDWIIQALNDFDFINIVENEDRIEFCLAAYQEFLWAHFALQELGTDPLATNSAGLLIKDYLLIREVREWICMILGKQKSDCLKRQLDYVKFKKKEEVGYRGSNALTLLCDLNRISYYKEQLEELKTDLWRRPLQGTDFRGIDLSGTNFHDSYLEGADFSYTKLEGTNFRRTDLAQTVWDEHGEMRKCAFLNQKDALCVVAGTYNGGVLTYNIDSRSQEVLNLQYDVINDLAGDRGGIYTASSDGWVGYIDKNGNLKNAYIARSGLQSIAHTNNASCVYVGAENQEIYRYNWNTGSRQKIEVSGELGNGADRISDIHYYSNKEGENYVAYTLHDKRLLLLVKLIGMNQGKVIAKAALRTANIQFGDICFANEMLIYSVIGRGVFGMPVAEMALETGETEEIYERELLNDEQKLLSHSDADGFSLGWASEKKKLMVVAKEGNSELRNIYVINLNSGNKKHKKIDLDWYFNRPIDCMNSDQVKGFSVSEDGEYIAFAGEYLVVFKKDDVCYYLSAEPVKAKISCKDADFSNSMGLNSYQIDFLKERNATIEDGGNKVEQK